MSDKKRFDDDGRTVADMSGVDRNPMVIPRFPRSKKNGEASPEAVNDTSDRPWENTEMNPQERRSFIFGATSAAALIGAVFIGFGAIVIFILWLLLK